MKACKLIKALKICESIFSTMKATVFDTHGTYLLGDGQVELLAVQVPDFAWTKAGDFATH